jgi:spore coat protein U domain-containing protein, fimbrial subunit CupE1/2/3/6
MIKGFLTGILIIVMIAFAENAKAGSTMSSFSVSTNAIPVCIITKSPSTMDFGGYDPTSNVNNNNGAGSFGFKCAKGTAYKVYITGTRTMTSGTETLSFELYSDTGRTLVFPSTDASGISGAATSNGIEIMTNIYGSIPAGQDVTAGKTFAQTLTVTVDY